MIPIGVPIFLLGNLSRGIHREVRRHIMGVPLDPQPFRHHRPIQVQIGNELTVSPLGAIVGFARWVMQQAIDQG